jgi:hypothetical protein
MSLQHELSNQSIQRSHSIIPTTPISLNNQRQLLMDDYVVENHWDCRRTINRISHGF